MFLYETEQGSTHSIINELINPFAKIAPQNFQQERYNHIPAKSSEK